MGPFEGISNGIMWMDCLEGDFIDLSRETKTNEVHLNLMPDHPIKENGLE
jgi:hypothetical protein